MILCVLALSIPCLLILNTMQVKSYYRLQKETEAIEQKQYEVIEDNRRLVSTISTLSSAERIEMLAEETLGMQKALPNDIIRVEVKGR